MLLVARPSYSVLNSDSVLDLYIIGTWQTTAERDDLFLKNKIKYANVLVSQLYVVFSFGDVCFLSIIFF